MGAHWLSLEPKHQECRAAMGSVKAIHESIFIADIGGRERSFADAHASTRQADTQAYPTRGPLPFHRQKLIGTLYFIRICCILQEKQHCVSPRYRCEMDSSRDSSWPYLELQDGVRVRFCQLHRIVSLDLQAAINLRRQTVLNTIGTEYDKSQRSI